MNVQSAYIWVLLLPSLSDADACSDFDSDSEADADADADGVVWCIGRRLKRKLVAES